MFIQRQSRRTDAPRAGFTLVELLMVIVIIAILLALIVPAAQGVINRARESEVAAELTGMETGCSKFKAKYGENPPSSVTLYEQANAWTPASKAAMRKIFGSAFRFDINRDINGNGNSTDVLTLTGDQCLVFFLGGLPDNSGGTLKLIGFSNSKSNPFSRGGSRIQFFEDFDVTRLRAGANGMPSFYDKLNLPADGGAPICYYSKTRTGRYEPTDCAGGIYHQGNINSPWKDIQVVSPGRDHAIGAGGAWNEDSSAALGSADQDNITNFSGGVLQR